MKFTLLLGLTLLSQMTFADYDETQISKPQKDSDELSLGPTICRTRTHLRWDVCYRKITDDIESMISFRFDNNGPNTIVPTPGFGVGRSYEFMFEDFARSDLGLLVWDMPDEVESHGHLKLMMFFPRTNLWSVNYQSDDHKDVVNVTTPNGEKIVFNGKTKEIVDGVLKEYPMAQDAEGNGLEPKFDYTGNGVLLWAHRLNDYPVGVAKTAADKNQKAYIQKKGKKLCSVKASDLWFTDSTKGGNVFFNKKYVTDQEFDKYVQKKCGFSIY